jgi:hypothetical protein
MRLYTFLHNLLNVLVYLANKIELQKIYTCCVNLCKYRTILFCICIYYSSEHLKLEVSRHCSSMDIKKAGSWIEGKSPIYFPSIPSLDAMEGVSEMHRQTLDTSTKCEKKKNCRYQHVFGNSQFMCCSWINVHG